MDIWYIANHNNAVGKVVVLNALSPSESREQLKTTVFNPPSCPSKRGQKKPGNGNSPKPCRAESNRAVLTLCSTRGGCE